MRVCSVQGRNNKLEAERGEHEQSMELEHYIPTRGIERGLEFHAQLTEIKPERTSEHQVLPEPLVYQEVQSDELRRRRGQAIQGNGLPFKRVK